MRVRAACALEQILTCTLHSPPCADDSEPESDDSTTADDAEVYQLPADEAEPMKQANAEGRHVLVPVDKYPE